MFDGVVVARPRGDVQFPGVGARGTWTRFASSSVAGPSASRSSSSARAAIAAIDTARTAAVRRHGRDRCDERAGNTRPAAMADLHTRLGSRGTAQRKK